MKPERFAELVTALVFVFTIGYVLWHVHQAALHHAFQVVTR